MEFNERQRLILMGVLQDQKELRARRGAVPMALARWIGHAPSNTERVRYHRACVRLEAMGLLVRCGHRGGRRTTHLRLTPAGLREAGRLWTEEYGLPADGAAPTVDWSSLESWLAPPEKPAHGE
jgi:DNA-binding MarR family transcriptional regulator